MRQDDIQLELPWTDPDDFGGMDAIYVDQGPYRSHYPSLGGYTFSCFYTPSGIKHLDGEFCREIIAFDGDERDYKNLRNRILRNGHLHTVIKNNLVSNLERVWAEKSSESPELSSETVV